MALRALIVSAVVAAFAAPPAHATQPLTSGGRIGVVDVPAGECDVRPVFASHSVRLDPPAIYARNSRRGGGNDSATVRWTTFLTDANGAYIQSQPFSGWASATDNRPARYTGRQAYENLNRYNSVHGVFIAHGLDVVVQWRDKKGRVTGSAVYRVASFRVVEGLVSYPASNCS